MKSIDKNAQARQTWLRQEQGLPFEVPPDHTVYRQSDFERTPIWRLTMVATFVVIVTNALSPAPQTAEVPVIATRAMV